MRTSINRFTVWLRLPFFFRWRFDYLMGLAGMQYDSEE
jgi:hypothetical protein